MDYDRIRSWVLPEVIQSYDQRDTILYALGVGYGYDPLDDRQLNYVYEDGLVAAPSMAAVLAYPGFWMKDPATGIDWVKTVQAEQTLTLHAPLPIAAKVIGRTRVTAIVDKGPGKGALVYQERSIIDATSGKLLATVEPVNFCRGDGGLDHSDPVREPAPVSPNREPDEICDLPTLPQAALIYRLSGDDNPLHADPRVAAKAGFKQPILHGLCTFGIAGHALLRTVADYDATRLGKLSARFSAPVFPGETIRTEIWREQGVVFFRARLVERNVVVLSNGIAEMNI